MVYESDYLCKKCGSLLYEDVKTKEEYCLNIKCPTYSGFMVSNNYLQAEVEINKKIDSFKKRLRMLSPHFKEYLFDFREDMFNHMDKGINIKMFHTLNELMIISSNTGFFGRTNNVQKFNGLINEFAEIAELENFLDTLKEEIHAMIRFPQDKDIRTLRLKYYPAFVEQYDNYGLINFFRKDNAFKYEAIDLLEVDRIPFEIGMEMTPFFKQFFRLMVQMKMLLEYNYRLSLIAKRESNKQDVAGLLSLFFSCKHKKLSWDNISFNNHLNRNEFSEDKKKSFKKFVFGDKKIISIGLDNLDKNIFHPFTLLFFSFYFMGKLAEADIVNKCKREASLRFEEETRTLLKEKGFIVPFNEEIELIKGSFKYDIIAISEEKKEVYLIESKYCDLPQSAFSGKKLKEIKLDDKNPDYGEISMAEEHKKRFDEFVSNSERFEKLSNRKIKGFKIKPLIVMKYTPILKSCEGIELLSYEQMKSFD
jgi:hypothetical protein